MSGRAAWPLPRDSPTWGQACGSACVPVCSLFIETVAVLQWCCALKPFGLVQAHSALLVLCSFLLWQVVRNPGSWNGFLWSVPSPSLSLGRRLEGKILPLCKKSTSLMALTVCDASFPFCLLPRIKAASKTSVMTLEVYLTQGDGPITFLSGSFH